MNYKGQDPIVVLDAPESFGEAITEMREICAVQTELEATVQYPYVLAFNVDIATLQKNVDRIEGQIQDDAIFYLAYPKKSSKKYKSDITRDQGWEAIGKLGYEPVRQVAIDADWSALRFRKVEHISKLTRNPKMILSEKGMEKRNNESD